MIESILISAFFLLTFVASGLIYYAFRPIKKSLLLIFPLLFVFVFLGYWQWGAWPAWSNYQAELVKKKQIENVLTQFKNPEQLIEKLKEQLTHQPQSSRGWYLLGRLYSSENQWAHAMSAYQKALQLNPQDEQVKINYAQACWYLKKQQFTPKIRHLLQTILDKNPGQPDALAMTAMDAYQQHNYQKAIDNWQKLLQLTSPSSKAAQALRRAIAKAQRRL